MRIRISKKKLKNQLILEYIQICQIKEFCTRNNIKEYELVARAQTLKQKYEQILFKIGCINLSFFILLKELKLGGNLNANINERLNSMSTKINVLESELAKKMRMLFFNEFEITFIEKFSSNIKSC